MASIDAFNPCFGKRKDLNSVANKDGQFLVTWDDGKIYFDFNGKRNLIGEAKNNVNIVTGTFLVSNWDYIEKSGIYTQTVELNSISGDYPLIIDLITSSDPEIGIAEQNNWSKITRIVADKNSIIAYCYDSQPGINLNFQAKEV